MVEERRSRRNGDRVESPPLDFLPHRETLCGLEAVVPHEQRLILRATAGNIRDHAIISLALGTGLRLAEVVGLDVGDVFATDGTPRIRVRVRSAIAKGGRAADVFLPDRLVAKLRRFWRWKRDRGESLDPAAPIFCNQSRRRISKRRVQFAWATWQRRAGFDRVYSFHALRPTAMKNVYRASRDLFPAQRFARHLSPLTTTVYTHPSDQEMAGRVRGLPC
jgi:integrase/recombinase XerC